VEKLLNSKSHEDKVKEVTLLLLKYGYKVWDYEKIGSVYRIYIGPINDSGTESPIYQHVYFEPN
jgi:hypothetical protein